MHDFSPSSPFLFHTHTLCQGLILRHLMVFDMPSAPSGPSPSPSPSDGPTGSFVSAHLAAAESQVDLELEPPSFTSERPQSSTSSLQNLLPFFFLFLFYTTGCSPSFCQLFIPSFPAFFLHLLLFPFFFSSVLCLLHSPCVSLHV